MNLTEQRTGGPFLRSARTPREISRAPNYTPHAILYLSVASAFTVTFPFFSVEYVWYFLVRLQPTFESRDPLLPHHPNWASSLL